MSVCGRYPDKGIDDIISGLPRHVLDKNFEHLPVKDAARTCILSRKWRYIWAMYPYLVFDGHFFQLNFANKPNNADEYINVIDQVLLRHDGPVLKFYLYIPNIVGDWDEPIDRWLLFVSRNGVKRLLLYYNSPSYKLPSYVFSCSDLTHFGLHNSVFRPPNTFSGFANIAYAEFVKVAFGAYEFDGRSPVAPLLSTLSFTSCFGIENVNICAPQLKKILIRYSNEVNPSFFEKFPNLTIILIYIGERLNAVYQEKGRLVRFSDLYEKFPRVGAFSCDGSFLNLSAPNTNQRRHSLTFQFLTNLWLNFVSFDDSKQISCVLWLLNSTPSLQIFAASMLPYKGTAVQSVLTQLAATDCVGEMLNLQLVELIYFEGSKPELLLIKCILANSPRLEYVRVKYSDTSRGQQPRIFFELMQFRRASAKAKIINDG